MNKDIEHYLYKTNFLDKEYCEQTINVLNKNDWTPHEWYDYSTDSLNSNNQQPSVILYENFTDEVKSINDEIIKKLHTSILEYLERLDFHWFRSWRGYSAIKFIQYNQGHTMERHCDHIHNLFDGNIKGIPTLSIIGLLNDNYEGGDIIMFEDKKINTKAGDLLIFPSNFLYPHEITPVTKGTRYSFVSWVW
tara:strand:+ start:1152 stop:1727 length:576 start_codon:yes stop_codon:yes gene_type:complete